MDTVKLTRLRFIGTSLAGVCGEPQFLAFARVGLMGSLTQTVIGMPCEKGINADHREH